MWSLFKENIISNLPQILRKDPLVNELAKAAGKSLDDSNSEVIDQYKNLYFVDTATWGLESFEKELGITSDLEKSYESRRAVIQAKWRGAGKLTLDVIDSICDSWKNADVDVQFDEGIISIKFVDTGGIPENLEDLKEQIENVKPAHIPVMWLFSYLTWDMLETIFPSWDALEARNLTWDELEVTVK